MSRYSKTSESDAKIPASLGLKSSPVLHQEDSCISNDTEVKQGFGLLFAAITTLTDQFDRLEKAITPVLTPLTENTKDVDSGSAKVERKKCEVAEALNEATNRLTLLRSRISRTHDRVQA